MVAASSAPTGHAGDQERLWMRLGSAQLERSKTMDARFFSVEVLSDGILPSFSAHAFTGLFHGDLLWWALLFCLSVSGSVGRRLW